MSVFVYLQSVDTALSDPFGWDCKTYPKLIVLTSVEMVGYGISFESNSQPLLHGIVFQFGSGTFTPLASCSVKLTAYIEHLLGTPFSIGMPNEILRKRGNEKKINQSFGLNLCLLVIISLNGKRNKSKINHKHLIATYTVTQVWINYTFFFAFVSLFFWST